MYIIFCDNDPVQAVFGMNLENCFVNINYAFVHLRNLFSTRSQTEMHRI